MPTTKILWTDEEIKKYVEKELGALSGESNESIKDLADKITKEISDRTAGDTALGNRITSVEEIAKGASRAKTFETNSEANTWISGESKATLRVGDNIYIGSIGVPDWYVAEILTTKGTQTLPTTGSTFNDSYNVGWYKLHQLETEKVILDDYSTKANTVQNITFAATGNTYKFTITRANNTTFSVDITKMYTDLIAKIPSSATFASNTLTFKNSSSATLYTVSLASLSVPDATNTTKGKVLLVKYSDNVADATVKNYDDRAITPKEMLKIVGLDYVNKTAFNTLNDTVSTHTTRLTKIEDEMIDFYIDDGLTVGGIIVMEIPD